MARASFSEWEEVKAFALSLPDTEDSTSYNKPAVKLNGESGDLPLW